MLFRSLSGLFEGQTTGAPLCLQVGNHDARPRDYEHLRRVFRPGHADLTWQRKFGIRDHRGGGRASGRETVARVAAGAVALQLLRPLGVELDAEVVEIGGVPAAELEACEAAVAAARAAGDSLGGVVELRARGVPPGWGEPVFDKLDARLAGALMSIGGVKGVELGDGFALARARGSEANDPIEPGGPATNRAGGVLGGISSGAELVVRLAVKPTPTIAAPQRTVTVDAEAVEVRGSGRHDVCLAPRVAVVAEAMLALVLVDAWMAHRARCG